MRLISAPPVRRPAARKINRFTVGKQVAAVYFQQFAAQTDVAAPENQGRVVKKPELGRIVEGVEHSPAVTDAADRIGGDRLTDAVDVLPGGIVSVSDKYTLFA